MRAVLGIRSAPLAALGVVAVLAAGGGAYAATSTNAGTHRLRAPPGWSHLPSPSLRAS